jgi:hypothetical protein
MATSPNYSWPEPDNTDLVKNGALAIRTMGNAIDTTMATMTPKSTYTAKGSIAAATAASTPANVSVGANDTLLVADSTAAAGVAWKSSTTLYPYQNWTITYTNISVGNGSVLARYQQIGKTINCEFQLTFGSTTTIASPARISTPVNSNLWGNVSYFGTYLDSGTAEYYAIISQPSSSLFELAVMTAGGVYVGGTGVSATTPMIWTTGDKISFRATYEAA